MEIMREKQTERKKGQKEKRKEKIIKKGRK